MSTYIPVALRKHIQEQFAHCCAYCQPSELLTVVTFEIEHIVPQSAGGTTTPENLYLACPACNRYKAVQQTAVDPLTNQTVSLFHPQQQRWLDHFVWNEDATQIVGTTAIGRATVEALKMNRSQLLRVRRMWVKMGEHPPG